MRTVNIGILGVGTIGGGTISVLNRNAKEIARRAGCDIRISHVANKRFDIDIPGLSEIEHKTTDAFSVVNDPSVDVVVELIGGYSPAKELVLQAIANGKHVVTANKALIALYGNEIFAAAQNQKVTIAFEASVAGGIPIIKTIRESLVANRIQWVAGIINGTSNFILTNMNDKTQDFASVLKEAQTLGYAEADPHFDVDGIDAAHKLTVLGSIAFGIPLQFDKVYIEGIRNINQQDVMYATELGYSIKHLGITRKTKHGIEMRVHPTLIPKKRLIANIDGVMNAVLVKGDAVGTALYYGAGAGAEPTAAAVIADLVDIARQLTSDPENRVPHLAFQPDALQDTPILPMEEVKTAYYLRLRAVDRPGVLAKVTTILGDAEISIEAILQKQSIVNDQHVPVILLTQCVQEKNMNHAVAKIRELAEITDDVIKIRMETLQ
ncbi:Homoserine dehydrogenase [uncultured Candidatus Thioglobus sp.]|nr:Homoserine dehydrogenase [uncultured Candidatus Thioglobus sp.]